MTIPFDTQPQLPVTVDLSRRDKNIFDTWKKVFIYIRNFGAKTDDIHLDFSRLSFQEKQQALHEFAFGEIEFRCKELEHSWTQLICKLFYQHSSVQSILSKQEEDKTLQIYQDEIRLAAQFCKSSLWWAADEAAKHAGTSISDPWFSETSSRCVSRNLWNLFIDSAAELDFLSFEPSITTCDFPATRSAMPSGVAPSASLLAGPSAPLRFGARTPQWGLFKKLMSQLSV